MLPVWLFDPFFKPKEEKGIELGIPSKCICSRANLWPPLATELILAATQTRSCRPLPTSPGNLHTHMKQPMWQPVIARFPVHKA